MPKARKDKIGSIRSGFVPAVANLAAATLVGADGAIGAMEHTCTVLKTRLHGRLLCDATDTPAEVVLYHDGLSDAEVEEYLELDGPNEPGQIDQAEVITRGRAIKQLGMVPAHGEVVPNDTMVLELTSSETMVVPEGRTLRVGVYNHGAGAFGAGALCIATCHFVVRWAETS